LVDPPDLIAWTALMKSLIGAIPTVQRIWCPKGRVGSSPTGSTRIAITILKNVKLKQGTQAMTKVGDTFTNTAFKEKMTVTKVTEEEINLTSVPGSEEFVDIMVKPAYLKKLLEKGAWVAEVVEAPKKKKRKRRRKKKKKE
jgi:hypothetical protein